MLPPGRDRLATKPLMTGSGTLANTMGVVRAASFNLTNDDAAAARITSRFSAANSFERAWISSALLSPHRYSILMLRPSIQPKASRASRKAVTHDLVAGSFSGPDAI